MKPLKFQTLCTVLPKLKPVLIIIIFKGNFT
jgi:hypothetical protein